MNFDQTFRQINFFGAIERGHIAVIDHAAHDVIHFGMSITQNIRADAHNQHVGIFAPVQIPDFAAFRFAEIGGPLIGQKHLGAFREQHVPAGNHVLCPFP